MANEWDGAEPIVNRSDPIPVLKIDPRSRDVSPQPSQDGDEQSSRRRLREKLSGSKLKDAFRDAGSKSAFADRLFASMLNLDDGDEARGGKPDRRSRKYVDRPGFSLPTMSSNFKRFNARIGVMFVFQNRAIRLFSWTQPCQTLSFLAVYSFCCLDPSLLAVLPIVVCLLFIMVPAFLARHPAPPDSALTDLFSVKGPANAAPANIKPAPEMSKDFFRNMRDLQNCMEDFSVVHDRLLAIVAPLTNFSNERVSSTLFLALSVAACFLFVASSLIPWRALFLVIGWIVVGSLHPAFAVLISQIDRDQVKKHVSDFRTGLKDWMNADIKMDEAPEIREVEMFELQRNSDGSEWIPWIYSTSPYTPRAPSRVSGERPKGTRFFEDVQPPKGFNWSDKKWQLDLLSREWVEERMITAVELETEGERWVYDIGIGGNASRDKQKKKSNRDWEEGTGSDNRGEWRRRRWVRLVVRKTVADRSGSASNPAKKNTKT